MLLASEAPERLRPATPVSSEQPCLGEDPDGTPFALCFDPGNGFELAAGGAAKSVSGTTLGTPVLSGGLRLRASRTSRSKGTLWSNTHRFGLFNYDASSEVQAFSVLGYEGVFRRHLRDGYILVPTGRNPLRIPFPFDLAISLSGLRYERRIFEGPGAVLDTGRAALLLDPIRSESNRARLGFGVALGHTARFVGSTWAHEFSPFTLGQLEASFESEDGLWALRLGGFAGLAYALDGASFFKARGELAIERVLFAIDDQPVLLQAFASGARGDAGLFRRDEWSTGAKLLVRFGGSRTESR